MEVPEKHKQRPGFRSVEALDRRSLCEGFHGLSSSPGGVPDGSGEVQASLEEGVEAIGLTAHRPPAIAQAAVGANPRLVMMAAVESARFST